MVRTVTKTKKKQYLLKNGTPSPLGDYLIKGGPGRPKGSKDKFTLFKQSFVELYSEEKLKEKWRKHIRSGSYSKLKDFTHFAVSVSPKALDLEHSGEVTEKIEVEIKQ